MVMLLLNFSSSNKSGIFISSFETPYDTINKIEWYSKQYFLTRKYEKQVIDLMFHLSFIIFNKCNLKQYSYFNYNAIPEINHFYLLFFAKFYYKIV